jgi:hypothetical protein
MVREMNIKAMICKLLGLAAVGLLAVGAAQPAAANIIIMESNVASINVGAELASTDTITIPAGNFIRAMLPSGKTQTIRGPYSGSVADIAKGQSPNEGVLAWVRNLLQTGGATETTPGATRSIGRIAPKPRVQFSWQEVPVAGDATICVQKGAALTLLRVAAPRADSVVVVDMASGKRAEVQWASGNDRAAWPADIPVRADGIYDLFIKDRARQQITLRVLDRLPEEGDVLTELHRLGCKPQFEAWVRSRLAEGKRSP